MRGDVDIPSTEAYEGFAQHENGIGMVRAFYDEMEALEGGDGETPPIVTGGVANDPVGTRRVLPGEKARRERTRTATQGPVAVLTGTYGEMALRPVLDRLERMAHRRLRLLTVPQRLLRRQHRCRRADDRQGRDSHDRSRY